MSDYEEPAETLWGMPEHLYLSYRIIPVHVLEKVMPYTPVGCFGGQEPGEMYFDGNQSSLERVNTVIHECLHAICTTEHVDLNHEEEEAVVSRLADGLTELLLRNPQILVFLVETLHGREGSGTDESEDSE